MVLIGGQLQLELGSGEPSVHGVPSSPASLLVVRFIFYATGIKNKPHPTSHDMNSAAPRPLSFHMFEYGHRSQSIQKRKKPNHWVIGLFVFGCLAMTYSHMGKPHTTIGEVLFHFWVRDGIRWFQYSMVAKQFLINVFRSYSFCLNAFK